MSRSAKLAALGRIAAILRETALRDLVQAKSKEAVIRERLATLAEARARAIVEASADTSAAQQLEHYRPWADAQRDAALAALVLAKEASQTRRAVAQRAVGRTEVLGELTAKLAAVALAERARKG